VLTPSTPLAYPQVVSRSFALFRVVNFSVLAGKTTFCSGFDSRQLHHKGRRNAAALLTRSLESVYDAGIRRRSTPFCMTVIGFHCSHEQIDPAPTPPGTLTGRPRPHPSGLLSAPLGQDCGIGRLESGRVELMLGAFGYRWLCPRRLDDDPII
jgi:hypothetical protein